LSAQRKATVVHAALIAVTVWPLVQIGLALHYDVSPWKLGGFGMYATPRFALVGMEIYGRSDAALPWQQLTQPTPELQAAAREFLESHRWLRRLASSQRVAELALASQPEWRELRVVVSYPVLDGASGRVVLTRDERVEAAAPR
jgi:hypothetical protein